MAEPSRAVFLSYASQDADAASRIRDALRAAGIEVWFDQSELRGGEAWDASIRRQIKGCRLFLPVISASTQAREEGYFRREWNLAVGRTLDMADDTAFLLPVVIDATPDVIARVPEKFREVQWTRLPGGETPASFVDRVRGLMSRGVEAASGAPASGVAPATPIVNSKRGERPQLPSEPTASRTRGFGFLKLAIPALLLIIAAVVLLPPWQRKEHARNDLLPAIQAMAATMVRSDRQIFDMAVEAQKRLPNDPTLA